ncbi:MAG: class I SAM-dependent methyltransferase [Propionicimonas sp.]|nr:class I SAM-dependent methyltransferase [Propionicimonas sp.]
MTNTVTNTPLALDPIKTKHRALWALGDYDKVATEVVAPLGDVLVSALDIAPGHDVLDVAAGSGNAALPAAQRGARVVATDLTPELLEIGRRRAEAAGLDLDWQQADAEHLPFADQTFDATISTVGVMFAPFHQPVADELVRVTRSGGTIGLINWTPKGFIGQMFATMKPYVAAPPAGAQPGPLWGTEDHLRTLFGDRVTNLVATRQVLRVESFATGAAFRDFFKAYYGPTIAAYRGIADQPELVAQLDQDLVGLAHRFGVGESAFDWEYLLVTATRR